MALDLPAVMTASKLIDVVLCLPLNGEPAAQKAGLGKVNRKPEESGHHRKHDANGNPLHRADAAHTPPQAKPLLSVSSGSSSAIPSTLQPLQHARHLHGRPRIICRHGRKCEYGSAIDYGA